MFRVVCGCRIWGEGRGGDKMASSYASASGISGQQFWVKQDLLGERKAAPGIKCGSHAGGWALAWRFYEKEKLFNFCLKGKSGWVKRWPGNGWGFVHDPGSPTVPHWNWSTQVGEAGFASKGGR